MEIADDVIARVFRAIITINDVEISGSSCFSARPACSFPC